MIRKAIHGSSHESVAKQMNNLGLLLINMGIYSEGESLFNGAMSIYVNLKNSEIFYLKTSTNLANLHVKRMKYEKAEQQLRRNLQSIYKYRFNDTIKNIIKIYVKRPNPKVVAHIQNCLLFDQYLIPEIVNIKFLIKLFEKGSNQSTARQCKKCLQTYLPSLADCDEKWDVLENISQGSNQPLFMSGIPGRSKVSFLFNKISKLMSTQ